MKDNPRLNLKLQRSIKKVKSILSQMNTCKLAITLDWLSLYFSQEFIPQNVNEGDIIDVTEDLLLIAVDMPTKHFNAAYIVYYKKENCGTMLVHPKSKKFFKDEIVKLDFANHTLYSQQWFEIYNAITQFGFKYETASRIDIAVDGANYLHSVLNFYAKQTKATEAIRLKNSSTMRARFNAKVLNPKTMLFENMTMGVMSGNKMITIYNKSLEIVKSGKKYIEDWWVKNGIIERERSFEELEKIIEENEKYGIETFHFEGYKNIYRCELRLKSKALKEIQNFTPRLLTSTQGLASILRTHAKFFFTGIYNTDVKASRCQTFDLLPYDRLGAIYLTKIDRVEMGGIYKAKMTIHGLIQDLYKDYLNKSKYNDYQETIIDRVLKYNLFEHVNRKFEEWHSRYKNFLTENNEMEVITFIEKLKHKLAYAKTKSNTDYLKDAHDQAGATAAFDDEDDNPF